MTLNEVFFVREPLLTNCLVAARAPSKAFSSSVVTRRDWPSSRASSVGSLAGMLCIGSPAPSQNERNTSSPLGPFVTGATAGAAAGVAGGGGFADANPSAAGAACGAGAAIGAAAENGDPPGAADEREEHGHVEQQPAVGRHT